MNLDSRALSLQSHLLHPLYFCEFLSEHQSADDQGCGDSGGVGEEAGGQGMAAAADGDRAEVDGEDIEGGFGSPENRAGELGGVAVGATGFDDLGKEARGRTAAERTDKYHRQDLRWQADQVEHWGEEAGQDVDPSSRTEDADRNENGDEVGEDPEGDLDSLLGPLDEFLINSDSLESGVEGEESEQERNRNQ